MPVYKVVEQSEPSSMYAEKFLVSLPVLLTLMTSLVFGFSYVVCWILEVVEATPPEEEWNAGREEPEPPSVETRPSRRTSDETEMHSQEQEQEGEEEEEERKHDSREERVHLEQVERQRRDRWTDNFPRPLVMYAMKDDAQLIAMRQGEHSGKESEKRNADKESGKNFSSTGKQLQQVFPRKADRSAGKGFHAAVNPRRPYLVTSVGLNELVVDDDDVTVIPIRTLPNVSVEVTVAFAEGGGGREKSRGRGGCSVVKRCAEEFGQQRHHCVRRCPCSGGLSSQDTRGDNDLSAELERNLRRISTLQLCRQATELESMVGEVRSLLARLRTDSTDHHQRCRRCDEEAERFSVHEDTDPENFSLPEHRNSCCGNDDDDGDRCCFGKSSRDRKLGQCTCRMEPDGRDVGQSASRRASEQETRSQASGVHRDPTAGDEATNSPKATRPHTSRSLTPYVTGTGNSPETSNPYDPVTY